MEFVPDDADLNCIEAFRLTVIKVRESFFLAQLGHVLPSRIGNQEKRLTVLLLKVFSLGAQTERPRYARAGRICGSHSCNRHGGEHRCKRKRHGFGSHLWRSPFECHSHILSFVLPGQKLDRWICLTG